MAGIHLFQVSSLTPCSCMHACTPLTCVSKCQNTKAHRFCDVACSHHHERMIFSCLSELSLICAGLLQEYGRCEPRGGPLTGDDTVAAVVKARGGDGVEAFLVGSDGAARGVTLTRAYACVIVQQALHEELLRSCGSHGKC